MSLLQPLPAQQDRPDQVIDSLDGDAARGGYAGPMPGSVRPRCRWSTQFSPNGSATAEMAHGAVKL